MVLLIGKYLTWLKYLITGIQLVNCDTTANAFIFDHWLFLQNCAWSFGNRTEKFCHIDKRVITNSACIKKDKLHIHKVYYEVTAMHWIIPHSSLQGFDNRCWTKCKKEMMLNLKAILQSDNRSTQKQGHNHVY